MSFHNNDTSPSTALQIVSMTAVTGDWQEVTLIVTSSMLATSTAGKHGSVSADCCHYPAQYVCPTFRAQSGGHHQLLVQRRGTDIKSESQT